MLHNLAKQLTNSLPLVTLACHTFHAISVSTQPIVTTRRYTSCWQPSLCPVVRVSFLQGFEFWIPVVILMSGLHTHLLVMIYPSYLLWID